MSKLRKGDTVFYFAQRNRQMPIRARVQTAHRDDTFTVVAQFPVDPDTGNDQFGYLGYRYRIHADDLYRRPK